MMYMFIWKIKKMWWIMKSVGIKRFTYIELWYITFLKLHKISRFHLKVLNQLSVSTSWVGSVNQNMRSNVPFCRSFLNCILHIIYETFNEELLKTATNRVLISEIITMFFENLAWWNSCEKHFDLTLTICSYFDSCQNYLAVCNEL